MPVDPQRDFLAGLSVVYRGAGSMGRRNIAAGRPGGPRLTCLSASLLLRSSRAAQL